MTLLHILQVLKQLTMCCTDKYFFHPLLQVLRNRVKNTLHPLYFYQFNYRGTFSFSSLVTGNEIDYGVAHGDELVYLFSPSVLGKSAGDASMSENDLKVVKAMVELWTSFAATGFVDKSCTIFLQF